MTFRAQPRCDDFDVIGAVPRDLSVIKNFLKRDCAVKRLIDIEEDFLQECVDRGGDPLKPKNQQQQKKTSGNGSANVNGHDTTKDPQTVPNYCDPCERLKTSVVLEELTKPATTNPVYNQMQSTYFDEETVMGTSLPVKFRFRRKANGNDVEKSSNLMCTSTNNTNVVVLTNCCDIMVWPSQRVAQMNRVPVTMISGPGDLTEYMLEEETIM
ncbi:GL10168 [Drosophila persimilis]|uniref:GL10168 n=1 Tax=Drosophila persimilis TaxID=7234 RepID=B4H4V1_DROPE|nr:uncharacterized protein LOC6600813 [Drosophila persimilis]EDW32787.1 GL10168 [Drosophila persimilis]